MEFAFCTTSLQVLSVFGNNYLVCESWQSFTDVELANHLASVRTSPYPTLTQSDFYSLGGFVVTVFMIAFAVKMVRKVLSVDTNQHN